VSLIAGGGDDIGGSSSDVVVNVGVLQTLPPEWVDIVETVQANIRLITTNTKSLASMHAQRLRVSFGDDEATQVGAITYVAFLGAITHVASLGSITFASVQSSLAFPYHTLTLYFFLFPFLTTFLRIGRGDRDGCDCSESVAIFTYLSLTHTHASFLTTFAPTGRGDRDGCD
jgi:hypothetical protein